MCNERPPYGFDESRFRRLLIAGNGGPLRAAKYIEEISGRERYAWALPKYIECLEMALSLGEPLTARSIRFRFLPMDLETWARDRPDRTDLKERIEMSEAGLERLEEKPIPVRERMVALRVERDRFRRWTIQNRPFFSMAS